MERWMKSNRLCVEIQLEMDEPNNPEDRKVRVGEKFRYNSEQLILVKAVRNRSMGRLD